MTGIFCQAKMLKVIVVTMVAMLIRSTHSLSALRRSGENQGILQQTHVGAKLCTPSKQCPTQTASKCCKKGIQSKCCPSCDAGACAGWLPDGNGAYDFAAPKAASVSQVVAPPAPVASSTCETIITGTSSAAAVFDSIGMELEMHHAILSEQKKYDTLLYESKQQNADNEYFFKIVSELNKNPEIVTGVVKNANAADKTKLRDWIKAGRDLSYIDDAGMRNINTVEKLGRQFKDTGAQYPRNVKFKPDLGVTWTGAKGKWSLQMTAQGPPRPHLEMMRHACDTVATPPQKCDTDWLKLQHIIQVHMCNSVKRYLKTPKISETKEALCFLTKATNIEDVLKRGDKSFMTWCAEGATEDLTQLTRSGPHEDEEDGANHYEKAVINLLDWANGKTKSITLKQDSGFPTASQGVVRIEYRQTKHFMALLQHHKTSTFEQKSMAVVNAIFRGCLPKQSRLDDIETDCPAA